MPTTTINALRGKSLYVDLQVEGVRTRFLVDSGAEVSIIPDSHEIVAGKGPLRKPRVQPVLVDGSELPVLGVASSSIVINGEEVCVDFYVVKASMSPILGSDIMKGFSWVRLDFANQAVGFGPVVSLQSEEGSDAPRVFRVALPEDVKVPSCHEMVVNMLVESPVPSDLSMLAGGRAYLSPV